jgi:hypothetical protein
MIYEIVKKNDEDHDLENVQFVLKATSEDRTHPYTGMVHVERTRSGSRLVCTDGRRLHVAEIAARIGEGEYLPVVTRTSVILKGPHFDGKFPNWRRIMPVKTIEKGTINLEKTALGKNTGLSGSLSIVYSQVVAKTGEVVNIRYLDDLPKKEWKLMSQAGRLKPILFQRSEAGKELFAVIMPMDAAA